MPTTVIHKNDKREPGVEYVYIGRPSQWGNPFTIQTHGRVGAIDKFRYWILQQPDLIGLMPSLKDRTLICWCKPEACHGDVLAELADMPYSELLYESALAILGDFIQVKNVPALIVDAYHHGIGGKLSSLTAKIYLLKDNTATLEHMVKNWEEKHNSLDNKNDGLQEEIRLLTEQISRLEDDAQYLNNENDNLREQLDSLQEERD